MEIERERESTKINLKMLRKVKFSEKNTLCCLTGFMSIFKTKTPYKRRAGNTAVLVDVLVKRIFGHVQISEWKWTKMFFVFFNKTLFMLLHNKCMRKFVSLLLLTLTSKRLISSLLPLLPTHIRAHTKFNRHPLHILHDAHSRYTELLCCSTGTIYTADNMKLWKCWNSRTRT